MRLGVNVDHIATVRNARGGSWPDPVEAALIAERAGAASIVMHLREDRRHIRDADVFLARRKVQRLNLEMSIAPGILGIAAKIKPYQVTFVPEKRQERTTEGGLDLFKKGRAIRSAIEKLQSRGTKVSLFIDPDPKQLDRAVKWGADAVEFHTGDYANAANSSVQRKELRRLESAVHRSLEARMPAYAGHGLDYQNVKAVVAIQGLEELNIGYSIVSRALWIGLYGAVSEMARLMTRRRFS